MSSALSRTGRPGPLRTMALTSDAGRSMCVTESPELVGLGLLHSVAPSPRPALVPPEREACSSLKICVSSLTGTAGTPAASAGSRRAGPAPAPAAGLFAQVVLDHLLQGAELPPRRPAGDLANSSRSMMPIWPSSSPLRAA